MGQWALCFAVSWLQKYFWFSMEVERGERTQHTSRRVSSGGCGGDFLHPNATSSLTFAPASHRPYAAYALIAIEECVCVLVQVILLRPPAWIASLSVSLHSSVFRLLSKSKTHFNTLSTLTFWGIWLIGDPLCCILWERGVWVIFYRSLPLHDFSVKIRHEIEN